MRVYLLIMFVALAVTFLTTPFARWLAVRTHAITAVRERDVHTIPTPRLGGVAMLAGLAAAIVFASRMPFLEPVFTGGSQPWAILGGAALVCLLGMADDVWELDWMTKLAGQVLAAGFMAWQGVQLYTVPLFGQLTMPSFRLAVFGTVLVVVIAMNAVNFVDGLDGLAAGVIAIGGTAFLLYTYFLTQQAQPEDYSSLATMVMAALVGVCLGFLPHNFNPARIFMGDSGSMLIGLVMAAATIVVTGSFEPAVIPESRQIPAFIPIVLPLAVILLPLVDMLLAVVRRLAAGKSPFHPDSRHLHHRLLALGHSHRRAVVIFYLWTFIFAFGTAALVRLRVWVVLTGLAAAVVIGLILTLGPLRTRGRFLDDAELPPTEPVPRADYAFSRLAGRGARDPSAPPARLADLTDTQVLPPPSDIVEGHRP